MKYRALLATVTIFALVTLSCGLTGGLISEESPEATQPTSPPEQSTPASKQPTQVAQPLRLIPIAVAESNTEPWNEVEAEPGWKFIIVDLALENASNVPQHFTGLTPSNYPEIQITTAEGYSYSPFSPPPREKVPQLNFIGTSVVHFTLPSGFRMWASAPCQGQLENPSLWGYTKWAMNHLVFQVAQNTHDYSVVVPGFEPINLDDVRRVTFPTDSPRTAFYDIGATVSIPDKGSVQVLRFEKPTGEGEVTAVLTVVYANASGGYDQTFELFYYVIGDDGILHPAARDVQSVTSSCAEPRVVVGPAQQLEQRLEFRVAADARNLKLIITSGYLDPNPVNAVFNLD